MKKILSPSILVLVSFFCSTLFAGTLAENLAEELYQAESNPKIIKVSLTRFMFNSNDKDSSNKMKELDITDAKGLKCLLAGFQGNASGASTKVDYSKAYLQKVVENKVTTWVLKGVEGSMGATCYNNLVFKSDKNKKFIPYNLLESEKTLSQYAKYSCNMKVGDGTRALTDDEAAKIASCHTNYALYLGQGRPKSEFSKALESVQNKIEQDPQAKNYLNSMPSLYCGKYIFEDSSKKQNLECTPSFVKMIGVGFDVAKTENGFCAPKQNSHNVICPLHTQPKGFSDNDVSAIFTKAPGDCLSQGCLQILPAPAPSIMAETKKASSHRTDN